MTNEPNDTIYALTLHSLVYTTTTIHFQDGSMCLQDMVDDLRPQPKQLSVSAQCGTPTWQRGDLPKVAFLRDDNF